MIWNYFIIFAVVSVILWTIGAWGAWRNRRTLAFVTTGLGLAVFFSYILYVDNTGASTAPYDGRNTLMV